MAEFEKMRGYFPLTISIIIGATAACSDRSGFEKTFVAKGSNYVVMVQLNSSDGHQLSGHIISTEVGEGWKVIAANKPITGTIEGNAINFTINHPQGNDPATTPVSGILSGDNLNLTFFAHEKAAELAFHRGSAEQYHADVQSTFKSIAEFD